MAVRTFILIFCKTFRLTRNFTWLAFEIESYNVMGYIVFVQMGLVLVFWLLFYFVQPIDYFNLLYFLIFFLILGFF